MPTPVNVARECLSDAAGAVLDDAVAVAKRRSHAQTTSLHVVSALLALPSSTLREACTRSRSIGYSPRLQFRALELCVGVALDRVSVSKSAVDEPPPVSNSLMAAIKRSQANQRRHPETFLLYQQQLNSSLESPPSISAVKVEMKHLILSILDDPIVSRVFGDAGFRNHQMKIAILSPLAVSRFSSSASRPPPLIPCSLSEYEQSKHSFIFPLRGDGPAVKADENSRRIYDVLLKKSRRNPLLIGACASDAYRNFLGCWNGGESGVLPKEIEGSSLVSVEPEVSGFISGGLSEESMELKFKQVSEKVEDCKGSGIVVQFGDLKSLANAESVDYVTYVVTKLKNLLLDSGGKVWLIGFLAGDGDYKKLSEQVPSIEIDLDFHLLPITSSAIGGKFFESSLMKSFVPFGGFFSMPSEVEVVRTSATQPLVLCDSCNSKYEQEVSSAQESTDSVPEKQSLTLPSWMQTGEGETRKRSSTSEATEVNTPLDARIVASQRKWVDICQRLHSFRKQSDIPLSFKGAPMWNDASEVGALPNVRRITDIGNPSMPLYMQNRSLTEENIHGPEKSVRCLDVSGVHYTSIFQQTTRVPVASASATTDLKLGRIFDSADECRRKPDLRESYHVMQNYEPSRNHEKSYCDVSLSSLSHKLEKHMHTKDLENPWNVLAAKVPWQMNAVRVVCQSISRLRYGNDRARLLLGLLGPDKIGKRKLASSICEIVFGRKGHFLCLDCSTPDPTSFTDTIVDCPGSNFQGLKSGRKMLVDYIAEELRKHPNSVMLLENAEKADSLVRDSLSRAITIGKFQDSHGRDINIKDNIFVLGSNILKTRENVPVLSDVAPEFPEEKILLAKNVQMQISFGALGAFCHIDNRNGTANVWVSQRNKPNSVNKRKLTLHQSAKGEALKRSRQMPMSSIDLNLSLGETGSDNDTYSTDGGDHNSFDDSESWLQGLLAHADENVVFDPYDFDSLAQKILKEIDLQLQRTARSPLSLEIDEDVMAQILAAAWVTQETSAMENWIKNVLCSTIKEALQKYNISNGLLVRLVPSDGLIVVEQACGVCLPARIRTSSGSFKHIPVSYRILT